MPDYVYMFVYMYIDVCTAIYVSVWMSVCVCIYVWLQPAQSALTFLPPASTQPLVVQSPTHCITPHNISHSFHHPLHYISSAHYIFLYSILYKNNVGMAFLVKQVFICKQLCNIKKTTHPKKINWLEILDANWFN